jgi:hypothetical protein
MKKRSIIDYLLKPVNENRTAWNIAPVCRR